jgi:diaminopimelate epimerase
MIVLNADGSRPEMCGNGVRCVVLWAYEEKLLQGHACTVLSDAGPRPSTLQAGADGSFLVTVAMGVARVSPEPAQVRGPERPEPVRVSVVDLGNPHGVVFDPPEAPSLVAQVEALEVFPRGVNVELVTPTEEGFRVRVHERGVGWTQACGTGACAVAAAAVQRGLAAAAVPVRVTLDGGALAITVDGASGHVKMTGPARRVFRATLA